MRFKRTPKNKAKDLIWKMFGFVGGRENINVRLVNAKFCARAACFEILDQKYLGKNEKEFTQIKKYWNEVLNELDKIKN